MDVDGTCFCAVPEGIKKATISVSIWHGCWLFLYFLVSMQKEKKITLRFHSTHVKSFFGPRTQSCWPIVFLMHLISWRLLAMDKDQGLCSTLWFWLENQWRSPSESTVSSENIVGGPDTWFASVHSEFVVLLSMNFEASIFQTPH